MGALAAGAGTLAELLGAGTGVGAAVGIGANLIAGLLGARSKRHQIEKQRNARLNALRPFESLLKTRQFGLSQSMGNIERAVTGRTISALADRGVLNSSVAAPTVAQAVAPIENQYQQSVDQGTERLAAAKEAIYQDSAMPGYGGAFANLFGDIGQFALGAAGASLRNKLKSNSQSAAQSYYHASTGQNSSLGQFGYDQQPNPDDPWKDMLNP